jgi:hypothetical protein
MSAPSFWALFSNLYEKTPEVIRIIAVMPLHRDSGYWLHRLG